MREMTDGAKTLLNLQRFKAVYPKWRGLIIDARVNCGASQGTKEQSKWAAKTKRLEKRLTWAENTIIELEAQAAERARRRGRAVSKCRRKLLNFKEVCADFVQGENRLTADALWPILRTGCIRAYLLDADETRIEKVSLNQDKAVQARGIGREILAFAFNFHGHDITSKELLELPDCLLFHPIDIATELWKERVPITESAMGLVGRSQAAMLLVDLRAAYQAEEDVVKHHSKSWKASDFSRPTIKELDILCAGGFNYDQIACRILDLEHSKFRATQIDSGDKKKGQPVKTYAEALRRRHGKPRRKNDEHGMPRPQRRKKTK